MKRAVSSIASSYPESAANGENCAALIPNGATLQLGIGAIPDAVLLFLKGKKDLGIHTEMFSDGVVELPRPASSPTPRSPFTRGSLWPPS